MYLCVKISTICCLHYICCMYFKSCNITWVENFPTFHVFFCLFFNRNELQISTYILFMFHLKDYIIIYLLMITAWHVCFSMLPHGEVGYPEHIGVQTHCIKAWMLGDALYMYVLFFCSCMQSFLELFSLLAAEAVDSISCVYTASAEAP